MSLLTHEDGTVCPGKPKCPQYQREMESCIGDTEHVLADALGDLVALYAATPGHDPVFVEKGRAALRKLRPWLEG